MDKPWEVQEWIECVYYSINQYIPRCRASTEGVPCPHENQRAGGCITAILPPKQVRRKDEYI